MPTIFHWTVIKWTKFLGPGEELAPLEGSLGATGLSPELFIKKEHSLETDTMKLIIYSMHGSKLLVKRQSCEGIVREDWWEIHSGMNVLCLCFRKFPELASHIRIAVDCGTDTLIPLTTPDLDIQWQSFVLADECPLPLGTMAGIKLGFSMFRQEKAAQRALEDDRVSYALTTNAALMGKMKLSKAQKILLRLDVRPSLCFDLNFSFRTCGGHNRKALNSKRETYQVFDYELASHLMRWNDNFTAMWLDLDEDTYWDKK